MLHIYISKIEYKASHKKSKIGKMDNIYIIYKDKPKKSCFMLNIFTLKTNSANARKLKRSL